MTYRGYGQPMELDKARLRNRCYICEAPGHRQYECPNRGPSTQVVRQLVANMTPEEQDAFLMEMEASRQQRVGQASKQARSDSAGFQQAQE